MDDLKLEGVVLTAAEAEVTSNADTHITRVDENNMEVSCDEAERPKTADWYHEDPFIIFIFYVPRPRPSSRVMAHDYAFLHTPGAPILGIS